MKGFNLQKAYKAMKSVLHPGRKILSETAYLSGFDMISLKKEV